MAEADFQRRRGVVITIEGAHFLVGVDRLLGGLLRSAALHRVMLRRPAVFVLFGVLGAAMVCAGYFALDVSNGFSQAQAWQRRGLQLAGVGAVMLVLGLLFAAWQWLGLWRALRDARGIGAIAPWTIELWWGPEGIGWREGHDEGLVSMAEVDGWAEERALLLIYYRWDSLLPVPLDQLTDSQREDLRATLRQARRPEEWTPSAEVLLARAAAAAHGADA